MGEPNITNHFVFCETEKQVTWLLSHQQYCRDITQFVAAEAEAAWALEQKGIGFFPLENLQTHHPADFIESRLNNQIIWAQNTDRFLQEYILEFQALNFCPARYYLYYLQIAWDTLTHRANLLEKFYHTFSPQKITYFPNSTQQNFNECLLAQQSVLTSCISHWAEYHNITQNPVLPSDQKLVLQGRLPHKKTLHQIANLLPVSRNQIQRIYRIVKNLSRRHTPRILKSEEKIILMQQYDINDQVCANLEKLGYSLVHLEDIIINNKQHFPNSFDINQQLQKAWDEIARARWFWGTDPDLPWSLQSVQDPLFRKFWFGIIPQLWRGFNQSLKSLNNEKYAAVVVATSSGTQEISSLMAARKTNIPIFFYMHGTSMGEVENTVWDVADRFFCDYMLVYGKGESDYIDRIRPKYTDIHSRTIPVGSARMDPIRHLHMKEKTQSIRRKILGPDNRPLVLYVPGGLPANIFRYGYHDFQNIRAFQVRKQVAALFNDDREVQLIYKPFSATESVDPTRKMLQKICPSCKIINNIPLPELQWSVDLIIHEIPSTGFHEALLTDKQIIAFVDRDVFSMTTAVKSILQKRVTISETSESFINEVQSALNNKNFKKLENPDDTFIKLYLTHFDDGQSAVRAADAIHQIILKEE